MGFDEVSALFDFGFAAGGALILAASGFLLLWSRRKSPATWKPLLGGFLLLLALSFAAGAINPAQQYLAVRETDRAIVNVVPATATTTAPATTNPTIVPDPPLADAEVVYCDSVEGIAAVLLAADSLGLLVWRYGAEYEPGTPPDFTFEERAALANVVKDGNTGLSEEENVRIIEQVFMRTMHGLSPADQARNRLSSRDRACRAAFQTR